MHIDLARKMLGQRLRLQATLQSRDRESPPSGPAVRRVRL